MLVVGWITSSEVEGKSPRGWRQLLFAASRRLACGSPVATRPCPRVPKALSEHPPEPPEPLAVSRWDPHAQLPQHPKNPTPGAAEGLQALAGPGGAAIGLVTSGHLSCTPAHAVPCFCTAWFSELRKFSFSMLLGTALPKQGVPNPGARAKAMQQQLLTPL